jgi:hypothetical protein
MRKILLGWFALMILAHSIPAQSRDPAAFLTGISPRDLQFKTIDTSKMVAPPPLQPDKFSFNRYFSKVLGFNLPSSFQTIFSSSRTPGIQNSSPFFTKTSQGSVPIPPSASPIQPLPPTVNFPTPQNTSPFVPLPPTTTLPALNNNRLIQPLPPIYPK